MATTGSIVGAVPAMKSGNHARVFIEALESLIVPIITSVGSPSGSNPIIQGVHHHPDLAPEAQQLITALNQFVTALVKPSAGTPQAVSTTSVAATSQSVDLTDDQATVDAVSRATTRKPRLLQLALDTMHHRVFNLMPIRLLTFTTDGSGIGLVERGQLWHNVSSALEQQYYNEDKLESHIRQIELEQTQRRAKDPAFQAPVESPEQLAIRAFLWPYSRYAILSHTWLQGASGEVTYSNWKNGNFNEDSLGYRKLVNFCQVAATDYNVKLGWMDTVCIDKESSSELDESIRSMWRWYLSSDICITYLADTTTLQDMRKDAWFTRGWTLQELLAPITLKFYNTDWRPLVPGTGNDKPDNTIVNVIHQATSITKDELNRRELHFIPISRRMQWAAARKVTREEDASYSLMGIFGVSFSIAYGEGSEKAFYRLAQAILNTRVGGLLDIVNWGFGDEAGARPTGFVSSFILPLSVKQYAYRTPTNIHWYPSAKPVTLTHLGLHVSVLLLPAIWVMEPRKFWSAVGDYHAIVRDVEFYSSLGNENFGRRNYSVLDQTIFKPGSQIRANKTDVVIFGVLNFSEYSTSIQLPVRGVSFAVILDTAPALVRGFPSEDTVYEPRAVKRAIAFDLKSEANAPWVVRKDDLHKHGITLRTMYL